MKSKLTNFIALDLGSSKIAAIGANIEKTGEAEITGQNLHYSDGIRSGIVTDLKQAEGSILQAVYSLETECNTNVNSAVISLSSNGTKSYYVENTINIGGEKITSNDVKKLIQEALNNFKVPEYEVIHYFPIEFSLDDGNIVDDPIGMFGNILECKLHIIATNSNILLNLTNCLAKCQVEVTGVILSIYAAGMACLTEDERNLGALIIDFGARTTSFGIFWGGKIIYTGHAPIGGWHITSDISKAFSIKFADAEKLKILYGNTGDSSMSSLSVNTVDDDYGQEITINSMDLADIIRPRVQEILDIVKEQYDKIGIDYLISRRIVLTGGGAMLKGLKGMVSTCFYKQTRIGKPKIFYGFAEDYNPGIYATSVGIIEAYVNRQRKNYNPALDDYSTHQGFFQRALAWFKANL
ncbi:MAG: cell division protein FtsA [Pseudomonadota bacterium]|jgi:cell division protein FtsA